MDAIILILRNTYKIRMINLDSISISNEILCVYKSTFPTCFKYIIFILLVLVYFNMARLKSSQMTKVTELRPPT